MKLAIVGTSGVGKTYLETLLSKEYGFFQLPKYTNRPQRPDEVDGQGIFFISDNEDVDHLSNPEYFFHLNYMGFNYGWKQKDLDQVKKGNATIAITLESMQDLLKLDLGFIPILLYIEPENINLIKNRLKRQLNYNSLEGAKKTDADNVISRRIKAAINETNTIERYVKIANKTGKAFEIKGDESIREEVIPYILTLS